MVPCRHAHVTPLGRMKGPYAYYGPLIIIVKVVKLPFQCDLLFSSLKLQCHGSPYPLEKHFTQVCINLIQKGQQTDKLQSATQVGQDAGYACRDIMT